jgi:Zn-dependent protease/predicted transcriptional regulator
MRSSFRIGRLSGISIKIDYSWFIIFALITWTLGDHYFPLYYNFWAKQTYWIMAVITSIIFFASLLAHEMAHSLVSKAKGVPVNSITLFIFGGVAEISDEPKKPAGEFWMAIAGPLTSLVLAIIFRILYILFGGHRTPFAAMAMWLSFINLTIAIFNLLPGFPLDGGRILRSIIWGITKNLRKATLVASVVGRVVAYLFILWGIWLILSQSRIFDGIWIAFIGWFLESAASSSYRQMALREALQGVKVKDIMTSDCISLQKELTIRELVDNYILYSSHQCFPVTDNNDIIGIVTLQKVKDIPKDQWYKMTMEEAMTPLQGMASVSPDDEVFTVMQRMAAEKASQFPVVKNDQLVGMVSRDNIMNVVNLKTELRV